MNKAPVAPLAVLFVCLGNICRSPTAEAVFRRRADDQGLADCFCRIDSAGTGDWHLDHAPDPRAQAAAGTRGYAMQDLRARQVTVDDFHHFDFIFAMDNSNLADLEAMQPRGSRARLVRFLDVLDGPPDEVPDPYYGGEDGFDQVLDLVECASDLWLERLIGEAGCQS